MSSSHRIITSGKALVLCPKITQHFGVSAALVLQQLHYWLSKENLSYGIIDENGYQWIRNTYEQWCEQIQVLTLSTLRRAFSTLEKNNIILSQRFAEKSRYSGGNQVKFYTINYDQLESVMGDLEKSSLNKPSRFTETNNGAGGSIHETKPDDSEVAQQHQIQNHSGNRSKQPTHLLKMNTLPAQNEHPLYITNTTSENTSKKTSLSEATQQLKTIQHQGVEFQTVQPDKPAERDKLLIVEEMISLWNTIVEQTQNKISITPKRSQHLNAAFKQYFNSDLGDWEAFCCKIASSKFLMGEVKEFKAYLDWSIRFDTIQRILEGGYSFGDRVVNYTPRLKVSKENIEIESTAACLHNEKLNHGDAKQESKEALAIRHCVRQRVGDAIYQSWFENTNITLEENEDKATIYVYSRFIADRLRTHYADIVETYFQAIYVGEPPKTESVTYSEITSTESVTPFVELPMTENNLETMSESAPELSNQVTLDMNVQHENPVDTHKEEFSQAEHVQHKPECVALINEESRTIECAINQKTVDPYLDHMHTKEKYSESELELNRAETIRPSPVIMNSHGICFFGNKVLAQTEGRGVASKLIQKTGSVSLIVKISNTVRKQISVRDDTEQIKFGEVVTFPRQLENKGTRILSVQSRNFSCKKEIARKTKKYLPLLYFLDGHKKEVLSPVSIAIQSPTINQAGNQNRRRLQKISHL